MATLRRDATLAGFCGAVFLAFLSASGALTTLGDPRAVGVGVGAGVLVESAFLSGTRVVDWWKSPWVAPASALVLLLVASGLVVWLGPVVLAAACWGLATYFVAFGFVVAGVWPGGED